MNELREKIITFISNNPKDFVNICFWVLTAILAFLTYKNAKKTLFNPIRSEMVKYQMKIITEFIDKHTSKGYNFDNSVDYSNLFRLNFETDYLFNILTSDNKLESHMLDDIDKTRLEFCKTNLGGLFEIKIVKEKLILDAVYGDFDTAKQYIQTRLIKEKEAQYNTLGIQRFYLTIRFYDFYTDLLNLKTNPFVPEQIKTEIENLVQNIYYNIGELYKLLAKHITEQSKTNYQEVYFQFINSKIDHKTDLEKLRKIISNYFKVN